jgi:DNA-binding transcriptional LysR family regulator
MRELPSLHALALYLSVVEHETMIAAAEAEGIGQPGISAQIKSLEGHYRVPLMERSGRRLRPTAAGRIVAAHARRLLDLVDDLDRALADLAGVHTGQLILGASETVGEAVLPEVLGRFRGAYPAVELVLQLGNSQEIIRAIVERHLSFGIVGRADGHDALDARPVFDDRLDFFARPEHPVAGRASLRLADLADETFVLREPGSATRELALAALAAHNFMPRQTIQLGNNEAVKRAVAAGLGIGILSVHTLSVDERAGNITRLYPIDWECRRQFWLIRRTDRVLTKPEQAFLDVLEHTPGVLRANGVPLARQPTPGLGRWHKQE